MPAECNRKTSGGKGNRGMFIERDPKVCAAGVPTKQADERVSDSLQHYLLKDEVDALLSDKIEPPRPPRPLPPLRHPMKQDQRHAGLVSELAQTVNPPEKSKYQDFTTDLKETVYRSYWKQRLGSVPDPTPMFPEGFDIQGTTYGKTTKSTLSLYDLVMPKIPMPGQTPPSKQAGIQTCRNYCKPAFSPDLTYGHRSFVDKRGIYAKCALTDDKVIQGTSDRFYISFIQADYQEKHVPALGVGLAPNANITCVPKGYTFGELKEPDNLPQCLSFCELNPGQKHFRNCLAHLNSLRKIMSTRYLPTFFNMFYLNLKYCDKEKTGWLPKDVIYNYCASKLIRFDAALIEPLLCMWEAFDGSQIEYKTFVYILNFKQPIPPLAKVEDIPPDCLDFRTTYTEMVKPNQEPDKSLRAGVPSGRYLDKDYPVTPDFYCRADRVCLSHESDMKSCLNPSIMTLVHVNHRDMYAKRDPAVVRRVYEAAGDKFTDEKFNAVWEEAKKQHSLGWVCYETFGRALEKFPETSVIKKEGISSLV